MRLLDKAWSRDPIIYAFELGIFGVLPSWPKRVRAPRFRAQPVRVGPAAEKVGPQKGIAAWWTVAHGLGAGTAVKDCSKLWEVRWSVQLSARYWHV